jgi:ribosomal protein S18 acetylase RimI-like enzyme
VLRIREASGPADYEDARRLFEEYAGALGFDLGFQRFQEELASLPGEYAPPDGCILLAEREAELCGCVAMRALGEGTCEMKRLFVRPESRHSGVGQALAVAVIRAAQDRGYSRMRLDTVASMIEARRLYAKLGFREIPPYRHNPLDGAQFFEIQLGTDASWNRTERDHGNGT